MSTEERPSAENADQDAQSNSFVDRTANEQRADETDPRDGTNKSESAKERPQDEAVPGDPNGKPSKTTADESAIGNPPGKSSSTDESVTTTTMESAAEPVSNGSTKNPAAVFLGRLGGLKGGKARAKMLTKAQRSEAARKAALARWAKKKKPQ